jgi:hypothetical protein
VVAGALVNKLETLALDEERQRRFSPLAFPLSR